MKSLKFFNSGVIRRIAKRKAVQLKEKYKIELKISKGWLDKFIGRYLKGK